MSMYYFWEKNINTYYFLCYNLLMNQHYLKNGSQKYWNSHETII